MMFFLKIILFAFLCIIVRLSKLRLKQYSDMLEINPSVMPSFVHDEEYNTPVERTSTPYIISTEGGPIYSVFL